MGASEKILEELILVAQRNRTGLFEAASDYCDEHDLDQAEFIASLDGATIEMLKADAMKERKVRQCVQPRVSTLI